MSADDKLIASLLLIQRDLYRFGGPILMVIGTVSSLLSLIVFNKKNLRKNPCSIYLTAYNICNILTIVTSILFATLANGYGIDPKSRNVSFCRFRYYTVFIFDVLGPSYLILASIDRVLVTSRNAATRRRSTPHLAFASIIAVTVFWCLLHIHLLVLTNMVQLVPGLYLCYFQPGMHVIVMTYYSLVVKNIIIPFLMVIFGLWTVKNVQIVMHVTGVSMVTTHDTMTNRRIRNKDRSKDRQLLRILLIDIVVYVIFNLMLASVLIYQQVKQNEVQSSVESRIQGLLLSVGAFSTFIPLCVGCYTNLLGSKTFRQEIKNILLCN